MVDVDVNALSALRATVGVILINQSSKLSRCDTRALLNSFKDTPLNPWPTKFTHHAALSVGKLSRNP
jgi:hypothetical protein